MNNQNGLKLWTSDIRRGTFTNWATVTAVEYSWRKFGKEGIYESEGEKIALVFRLMGRCMLDTLLFYEFGSKSAKARLGRGGVGRLQSPFIEIIICHSCNQKVRLTPYPFFLNLSAGKTRTKGMEKASLL